MLLSWNHLFVTDSKQHKEGKPKDSLCTEVNLMRLSATIPTVLLHYKMYNFLKSKWKAKITAVYCMDSESYSKYFFWFCFFNTYKTRVVRSRCMQPEYEVLHKWDSYTCGYEQPVWLLAWLVGRLGLAMEVQGSMPKKFSSCAQAERPCHVAPSLEN